MLQLSNILIKTLAELLSMLYAQVRNDIETTMQGAFLNRYMKDLIKGKTIPAKKENIVNSLSDFNEVYLGMHGKPGFLIDQNRHRITADELGCLSGKRIYGFTCFSNSVGRNTNADMWMGFNDEFFFPVSINAEKFFWAGFKPLKMLQEGKSAKEIESTANKCFDTVIADILRSGDTFEASLAAWNKSIFEIL